MMKFGFGRNLMNEVKELTVHIMVLQKGNRAIEDLVTDVLSSHKLKRIFWSCCKSKYSKAFGNKRDNTLELLYAAMTKKSIHGQA